MREMDTPLDHGQEKVDASGGMGSDSGGALQPQWACKCDSIHKPPRNSLLRNKATFSAVTEANKKLFWLSVRGRMLNVYFQGPDGQSRDSWLPVEGESTEALWPGLWMEWRAP